MKKLAFLLLLPLMMSIIACAETPTYDIYVTVYPLQFITEEIVKGTSIEVGIVPGVSSHQDSVDWAPKEIIAMTQATYLFYVGANYDPYIDFQIESIFQNRNAELVKIEDQTDYITFIPGIVDVHDDDATLSDDVTTNSIGMDPHFWISPEKMIDVSKLVFDKLLLKYPDIDTLLEVNYNNLVARLQALSDDFTNVITQQEKIALFSTNLYGYLREDYGLEYISISPGYHEETEQFTTAEKEEIVSEIMLHNIQVVIFELYTTSPLSNAVFTELNTLGVNPIKKEYNILQSLSDDERNTGEDYISKMQDNLDILRLALGLTEE